MLAVIDYGAGNLRSVLHTVRRALTDAAPVKIVNVHGLGYKLVSR